MIDKSLRTALLFLLFLAGTGLSQAQTCENRCLSFDGTDDAIRLPISPVTTQSEFTLEAWVYSSVASIPLGTCDLNLKTIFYLGDFGTNKLELGECDGVLHLDWSPSGPADPVEVSPSNIRDAWHHVALVRDGNTLRVFLDFEEVFSTAIGVASDYNSLLIGHGGDPEVATPGEDFEGRIDEVRVWESAQNASQLEAYKRCALSGTLPGTLLAYWPMNQGVPGGNNMSITELEDVTGNGYEGLLTPPPAENFLLSGPASNFVCSDVPTGMEFHISQLYLPGASLEGICSGAPASFCVTENGGPLGSPSGFSVEWEYFDGAGWESLSGDPDFSGFCFSVPPGNQHLSIDCAASNSPEEKKFRPVFTVTGGSGTVCTWTLPEKTLLICCPAAEAEIQVVADPAVSGPVCQGEELTLEVTLTTDAAPGNGVEIRYTLNGAPLPDYDDLLSFSHAVVAGGEDICIEATVSSCSCPPLSASACIEASAQPVCGTIESKTSPLVLIPDTTTTDLYSICPGNGAVLGMADEAAFEACVPVWQYMFPSEGIWKDLGSTNSNQQTNVLPVLAPPVSPYEWPAGETCIVYRIECRPLDNPAGCEACHSNEITICLQNLPEPAVISGDSPVCSGETSLLFIADPDTGLTYRWFFNGTDLGYEGEEYEASEEGCYQVQVSSGCLGQAVESQPLCLEVCELKPVISCPLAPNPCPSVGDPITLSACETTDSCTGILDFVWEDGDGNSLGTGCTLIHTPDTAGTEYVLTVTNTSTNCSATISRLIIPCMGN